MHFSFFHSFLCIPISVSCSALPASNVITYSSVLLSHFKIKLINISISHGIINTTLRELEAGYRVAVTIKRRKKFSVFAWIISWLSVALRFPGCDGTDA